jgi:hypothetical protein|tara:strand:+ start:492 stop:611 length:120 start_codon:yes stop_codon:yes gene_type:complete
MKTGNFSRLIEEYYRREEERKKEESQHFGTLADIFLGDE